MQQETPMQIMLKDLEYRYKISSNADMTIACASLEVTISYAKYLIKKEREQIIDAYNVGYQDGCDRKDDTSGSIYYNESFSA